MHFIYGYVISDTKKDHLNSERGNPLVPPLINSKGSFLCTIPQTQYFITPGVEHWLEWEIAQWDYH